MTAPQMAITQAVITLDDPTTGAAKWVSPTSFTASSLETGRIGYITAWGGSEYGYAYTYGLQGAPSGTSVDADAGILSVGVPLAVGSYSFAVLATNRENPALSASFPVTLTVRQGVTSNRTGTQTLHKTYDPHSGTYGSPSGNNNWTQVLLNINGAIIADQFSAGNENLRATIIFRHGVTYQYTNNNWLSGIQYFRCIDDPAHLTGALPVLQCINANTVYDGGPLNIGTAGAISHQNTPNIKSYCGLLQAAAAGDSTVTLKSAGDAGKFKVGRWHVIVGQCQQLGGYPPNVTWLDYVIVTAINGATVTLDRKLKRRYSPSWWEDTTDDQSFGRAWLVPWDAGGMGGSIPSDPRTGLRCSFKNLNFAKNPNGAGIMLTSGFIDLTFDGCTMQSWQPTMGKHHMAVGCTFQPPTISGACEPDKISETLVIDNCTTDTFGGATGFSYVLVRNTHATCWQVSPRQLRILGCNFTPGTNTTLHLPLTFAYNGPIMHVDIQNTIWGPNTAESGSNTWTYAGNPDTPARVGIDATWSGNRLIIPRSFAGFQDWLVSLYEGAIISLTGVGPVTSNWGYVTTLSAPSDASALWLDIAWVNGAKPTSGNVYSSRGRRLNFAGNSFVAPMGWADPKFFRETSPQRTYGFPAGYPAAMQ